MRAKTIPAAMPDDPEPAVRVEREGNVVRLVGEKKRALEPRAGKPNTPPELDDLLAEWSAYSHNGFRRRRWAEDLDTMISRREECESEHHSVLMGDPTDGKNCLTVIVWQGAVHYAFLGKKYMRLRAKTIEMAKAEVDRRAPQRLVESQHQYAQRLAYRNSGFRY